MEITSQETYFANSDLKCLSLDNVPFKNKVLFNKNDSSI